MGSSVLLGKEPSSAISTGTPAAQRICVAKSCEPRTRYASAQLPRSFIFRTDSESTSRSLAVSSRRPTRCADEASSTRSLSYSFFTAGVLIGIERCKAGEPPVFLMPASSERSSDSRLNGVACAMEEPVSQKALPRPVRQESQFEGSSWLDTMRGHRELPTTSMFYVLVLYSCRNLQSTRQLYLLT